MLYVFVCYNRIETLKISLEMILKKIDLYNDSLVILSDGARSHEDKRLVKEVRNEINELLKRYEYNNSLIIERKNNYGLKKNILDGLSIAFNEFTNQNTFIVIEDDIVITEKFIELSCKFEELSKSNDSISSFSGWFWPTINKSTNNYFLSNFSSCWGWGGRKDYFIKFLEIMRENELKLLHLNIKVFNEITMGNNTPRFIYQVFKILYYNKKTWAIYWYLFNIKNGYKTLYFKSNSVVNIGFNVGENYNKGDRLIVSNEQLMKDNLYFNEEELYLNSYFKKYDKKNNKALNILIFILIIIKIKIYKIKHILKK